MDIFEERFNKNPRDGGFSKRMATGSTEIFLRHVGLQVHYHAQGKRLSARATRFDPQSQSA